MSTQCTTGVVFVIGWNATDLKVANLPEAVFHHDVEPLSLDIPGDQFVDLIRIWRQ